MIYKEKNKRADHIIKDILEFCAHNNFPKQFCSDNRPEIKNLKMQEVCVKNGITYIYGIPYNPHTNGAFERFH